MSDQIEEIKRLYYSTGPKSIHQDFARAIDLLKSLATEEERERVAVYMEGLAAMRSQWEPQRAEDSKGRLRSHRRPRTQD
ncbi:MAG: hypothetical protein LC791_08180 [Acidobacteria bacterium]|nr:hypothetical protein [Acidobacteriota bacterium]